jgi:Thiol:disulfide interchange protein DsbD, N-terminal
VLDESGAITARYFEQSYRVRPTAALFREIALGSPGDHPPALTHADEDLRLTAWTDMSTYRPYQQQRLHVQVDLPAGAHMFASPVPDGYAPLRVEVEPLDGLTVGEPEIATPTQRLEVPGVDDELLVYTDGARVRVPLLFTKNLGDTSLQVQISYQSCTESVCYPPRSALMTVTLEGLDLIRD